MCAEVSIMEDNARAAIAPTLKCLSVVAQVVALALDNAPTQVAEGPKVGAFEAEEPAAAMAKFRATNL
uniref:Uncharacterized protein n=1 Tax=Ditylenchus dipsaci TaxID=166011 RepID=A0A915ESQ4_9BILA